MKKLNPYILSIILSFVYTFLAISPKALNIKQVLYIVLLSLFIAPVVFITIKIMTASLLVFYLTTIKALSEWFKKKYFWLQLTLFMLFIWLFTFPFSQNGKQTTPITNEVEIIDV